MKNKEIIIEKVLKKPIAILHSDGILIQEMINSILAEKTTKLTISFAGIKTVTTAFINASMGKLIQDDKMKNITLEFGDRVPIRQQYDRVVTGLSFKKGLAERDEKISRYFS